MNMLSFLLATTILCFSTSGKEKIYHGSTPLHLDVRDFLGISLTDSIDFIRWNLKIHSNRYELNCQYGLSKGGTNGFLNEKKITFTGHVLKQDNYYKLQRNTRTFYMLEINSNMLHLTDKNKALLVGNGGYSYALNIITPRKTDQFNLSLKQKPEDNYMVFQGRTPCQELSKIMGQNKGNACDKLKWYIILYLDSVTRKPTYYLKGGRGYKKETMSRGTWQINKGSDGRVIYILDPEKKPKTVYLVKADNNILFFTDPEGNLLVGNENFSYTLNRSVEMEPWNK